MVCVEKNLEEKERIKKEQEENDKKLVLYRYDSKKRTMNILSQKQAHLEEQRNPEDEEEKENVSRLNSTRSPPKKKPRQKKKIKQKSVRKAQVMMRRTEMPGNPLKRFQKRRYQLMIRPSLHWLNQPQKGKKV